MTPSWSVDHVVIFWVSSIKTPCATVGGALGSSFSVSPITNRSTQRVSFCGPDLEVTVGRRPPAGGF